MQSMKLLVESDVAQFGTHCPLVVDCYSGKERSF